MRIIDVLQADEVHAMVTRATRDGTVEEDALYQGLSRLERRQYNDVSMLLVADVLKLVEKLAINGIVSEAQLYDRLRELKRTRISEQTVFDVADAQHQNPAWPPQGLWPNNEQGKVVSQEVQSSDVLL